MHRIRANLIAVVFGLLSCLVGCDGGDPAPPPASDAGTSVTCGDDHVVVRKLSGQVLDIHGDPPTLKLFTLCSGPCVFGKLDDDGRFELVTDFCFPKETPVSRPIFIYHGNGVYSDAYYDFVPPGATEVIEHVFPKAIRVVALGEMASLTVDEAVDQTLSDGLGFELSWSASAVESLPILIFDIAVKEMPKDQYPPVDGVDTLTALYAVSADGTKFAPSAQVRFPNHAGLPAGTTVQVLTIGTLFSTDPHAGALGAIGTAVVSADAQSIFFDKGITDLVWIGYRPVSQ